MDECICKGTTWFTALNSPEEIKMKPFPIKDHLYYDYTINDKYDSLLQKEGLERCWLVENLSP